MLIPKHTVYEGVLHGISGGEVIQGTGGGTSTTVVVTDYSATAYTRERAPKDALGQKGWTRREFVDIGDTRIRNLVLTPYYDELLKEAVGQEVAISVTGTDPSKNLRHTVMAIRTPRGGLNRVSRKVLLAGSIVWLVKFWIGAPILALLILLAAAVAGKIFEPLLWIGVAVAAIAFVYLLVLPFVGRLAGLPGGRRPRPPVGRRESPAAGLTAPS